MANIKRISCIIFAFMAAAAPAAFANGGSDEATAEKAKPESAEAATPESASQAPQCPVWGSTFYGGMPRHHRRMMHLFDSFFDDAFAVCRPHARWRQAAPCRMPLINPNFPEQPSRLLPDCEIRETKDSHILSMEVPGIPKECIKIDIEDNVLTISGEKKESLLQKGENRHASERVYGAFMRSFTLPRGTDPDKIKAECRDGVLTVTIAKPEEGKPASKSVKVE